MTLTAVRLHHNSAALLSAHKAASYIPAWFNLLKSSRSTITRLCKVRTRARASTDPLVLCVPSFILKTIQTGLPPRYCTTGSRSPTLWVFGRLGISLTVFWLHIILSFGKKLTGTIVFVFSPHPALNTCCYLDCLCVGRCLNVNKSNISLLLCNQLDSWSIPV